MRRSEQVERKGIEALVEMSLFVLTWVVEWEAWTFFPKSQDSCLSRLFLTISRIRGALFNRKPILLLKPLIVRKFFTVLSWKLVPFNFYSSLVLILPSMTSRTICVPYTIDTWQTIKQTLLLLPICFLSTLDKTPQRLSNYVANMCDPKKCSFPDLTPWADSVDLMWSLVCYTVWQIPRSSNDPAFRNTALDYAVLKSRDLIIFTSVSLALSRGFWIKLYWMNDKLNIKK